MKKEILLTLSFWVFTLIINAQSGESPIITMDTKNPEIILNAPNGGGNYNYSEPLEVTWTALDDSFGTTPISAGMSTEESGPVTWLIENIENTGTGSVDPPDIVTEFAKAHIKAVDAFGNEAVDMSDGYFELTATLEDGLVAYYPFNGNAEDESGN